MIGVVIIFTLGGVVTGFALGDWFASRWIDHRWYCGRRHRASHPCQPSREYLASSRKREEDLGRAEELETEATGLRRRWWS